MASFDVVNYSLRPSKSIQRQVVFDGVRLLQNAIDLNGMVYVGFGSVWFTDFVLAHRTLGIDDMVSIEADDVGFSRAAFNTPYATVRVLHGKSFDVLPTLFADEAIAQRPWMIWLDYDYEFDESLQTDVRSIAENAPPNSVLLLTFNGQDAKYGEANDRAERLRGLFGSVVPDDLSKSAVKDERLQQTLADLATDFVRGVVGETSRPGGFVPAFRLVYKDTAPMITVGGVLPTPSVVKTVSDLVANPTWPCRPVKPIVAPHLTIKEATVLQALLPRPEGLSRAAVKALGFDLEDEQIEVFATYYRQYPSFAQIIA